MVMKGWHFQIVHNWLYPNPYLLTVSPALINAVSFWFLTVQDWVQSQDKPWDICGGQRGTVAGFLLSTLILPCQLSFCQGLTGPFKTILLRDSVSPHSYNKLNYWTTLPHSVRSQVLVRDEDLVTEDLIMCCLVRAIGEYRARVEWWLAKRMW